MKSYYIYILASHRNGTLYVGVTSDILRRIYEHKNDVTGGFTSTYNVKTLVWFEETPDITEAIRQEKRMKKWPRAWKINVIEAHNPQWLDLYPALIS
ncbi:MAG: GIY-YIG nuclease family protein [Alphaproteobacteria bacterium]